MGEAGDSVGIGLSRDGDANLGEMKGDDGAECSGFAGTSVKTKIRGSICQKLRRLTNMRDQAPDSCVSLGSSPTEDSSDAMSPMRSSFCSRLRPLKIPSLLRWMRHSPFGLPVSGV